MTEPDGQVGRDRELVVFWVRCATQCGECGVELDHLEDLSRGDAALTRRARRYSKLQEDVAIELLLDGLDESLVAAWIDHFGLGGAYGLAALDRNPELPDEGD